MEAVSLLQAALFGTALLAPPGASLPQPGHFGFYYSGPPCHEMEVDRTYGQFQVNLDTEDLMLSGMLRAGDDGDAVLVNEEGLSVRLLTNASRADWLLKYPFPGGEVGVWGHRILHTDCSITPESLYLEALYPLRLLSGPIDPRLDLAERPEARAVRSAASAYRRLLAGQEEPAPTLDDSMPVNRSGGASRLEAALFSPESARDERPWRVRLMGGDETLPGDSVIDILVSGSDGSVGVFGHIATGGGGMVYNVYPKGSLLGAPGPVPIGDYLFNAQRGQALRRPTWILRLEGLPAELVESFRADLDSQVRAIDEGRMPYHPTANNCTIVSLNALSRIGFDVAAARYFTRRFPRPAFGHILSRLPRLLADGKLPVKRVELAFVPQVSERLFEGGAPNRPLRDRSKVN